MRARRGVTASEYFAAACFLRQEERPMNTFKALALTCAAFTIATAQAASASPGPNGKLWSGSWHLNVDKSKFASPASSEKSEVRAYRISGNHVTMRSTVTSESGKVMRWGYSAATDGKWYLTTGNPTMDHIKLTGVSGTEIKAETLKLKESSGSGTLTLSEDGKELTLDRTGGAAGTDHDVLVFDRIE
jgi:hypothetical protein